MFSSNSNLSVFSQILLSLLSSSLGEALHVKEGASEFRVRYEYIFSVYITVGPMGGGGKNKTNQKNHQQTESQIICQSCHSQYVQALTERKKQ